jgi:RimJ/RimL family protein N-acetyltransferase
MIKPPILDTARLRLHPIEMTDAPSIEKFASAREIADTMISIPHPYPPEEARQYVTRQQAEQKEGRAVAFSIRQKSEELFCGLVELRAIDREHLTGELSFWLAVEFWGHGYMSEAIHAVVQYGFEDLGLNRLYAFHMMRNPACGRLLQKSGFKQEGLLRECVWKWGQFEDVALQAILRREWSKDTGK